jgi:hypothetical protein
VVVISNTFSRQPVPDMLSILRSLVLEYHYVNGGLEDV